MHEIMFSNAKKLNTITAFNTFIINYPTAVQVKLASENAMEIERELYTQFGLFSFLSMDKEKEKKARKLLIAAKQIERYPSDNKLPRNQRAGYMMVADRMYDLLQDEFDEADATLRHLESQEFKDFARNLRTTLDRISNTLERIESNTKIAVDYAKEAVDVSRKGFAEAGADRAMSEYHTRKYREWKRYLQESGQGD